MFSLIKWKTRNLRNKIRTATTIKNLFNFPRFCNGKTTGKLELRSQSHWTLSTVYFSTILKTNELKDIPVSHAWISQISPCYSPLGGGEHSRKNVVLYIETWNTNLGRKRHLTDTGFGYSRADVFPIISA